MLVKCWARVEDDGPTLHQYWVNLSWDVAGTLIPTSSQIHSNQLF